jgi:hypothetical protein
VFNPADDALLDYLNEEGQSIEPVWYMPILPMVLVNGAEGIGTGWSTFVPNYSPRDIAENLKVRVCRAGGCGRRGVCVVLFAAASASTLLSKQRSQKKHPQPLTTTKPTTNQQHPKN